MESVIKKVEGTSWGHGEESWAHSLGKLKDVETVVDYGMGKGRLGKLMKKVFPNAKVIGVDGWEATVNHHKTSGIYDEVILGDMRDLTKTLKADLWIFGDCLEHILFSEVLEILSSTNAKYIGARIPVGVFKQGVSKQGNELEAHLWSFYHDQIDEFSKIRKIAYAISNASQKTATNRGLPVRVKLSNTDVNTRLPMYEKSYIANIVLADLM